MRISLMGLFVIITAAAALAVEPSVAPVFSDGLVLQRDRPIPVFGTADDGVAVTVQLGDDRATAKAADGVWRVDLPARQASAEPVAMTISFGGPTDPPVTQTIHDILIGEVWLCAGQSNMAQSINKRPPVPMNPMPHVRQFERRIFDKDEPRWLKAEGDELSQFSITAVYFGEALHQQLDVPIGLILTAASGTQIERWIPRDTLEADPATKRLIDMTTDRESREKIKALAHRVREGGQIQPEEQELWLARNLGRIGDLYRNNIDPVAPFPVRGVIWYQGEANAREDFNAAIYDRYLAMLISGLREKFSQPELPFYIVQLPSIAHEGKDGTLVRYELIRQKQLEAARAATNAGLAVTIDINEGLHPRSKHITGRRLAMLAMSRTYGQPTETPDSGPLLQRVTFKDGSAICTFAHVGGALKLAQTDEPLFELAGENGKFHPATARVAGEQLVVRSDQVDSPQAVRYAFSPVVARPALFGAGDLPASPFVWPADN